MLNETFYHVIFIATLVIYAGIGAAIIYHLLKFDYLGHFSIVMAIIFAAVSLVLITVFFQVAYGAGNLLVSF